VTNLMVISYEFYLLTCERRIRSKVQYIWYIYLPLAETFVFTVIRCDAVIRLHYDSFAFQQSVWSQIFQHRCIRQAKVQSPVRRARLLLCWNALPEHFIKSVTLAQFNAFLKLNYSVELTITNFVSTLGRFVNSKL